MPASHHASSRQHSAPALSWPGWVAKFVTFAVVVGTMAFVVVQLDPGLIFGPNTDVGGDNAAHIAAAYYLIHDLLPRFQISGWDPQWFGGFPLYVFYFPLPALIIAVLSPIFHYTVSFKLVTILGTVLMPLSAYLFGRLCGFARPVPALMSAAMVAFLFNTSYTIDGGNIASTLAGEFSFTLAVAVGMTFLGMLSYSLRTGRLRWLAALLFAATALCHVVPALYFAGAAIVLTVFQRPTRLGLRVLAPVGVVGGLIAAFWLLPFGADLRYSTCMCYLKVGDPLGSLFPASGELAVQVLAGIGLIIAAIRRDRVGLTLGVMCAGAAGAFMVLPASVVYNGRWLPFWFLSTALLGAYGVGGLGSLAFDRLRRWSVNEWLTPLFTAAVAICVAAAYLGVLPGYTTPAGATSFVPDWVTWNYSGYQGKAGWPEFERLLAMLQSSAAKYGCGRLDYEYSPNVNNYFGSTIVEMSFPYWTNGCIDSSEGLYYESSTSTPFHFLDQAELSIQPSNPVPNLPYQSLNVADGIRHLQLGGVKYFLANSPEVEQQAALDPALVEIASMPAIASEIDGESSTAPVKNPRWVLYEIKDSPLVTPLRFDPVVEPGLSKSKWLSTAIAWYQHPADWGTPLAESGPPAWPRATAGSLTSAKAQTEFPTTNVSAVRYTNEQLSFKVATTGVPVLIKVPFFPNWHASGATGPYPVSPNFMVVVPTSHTVTLSYGMTTVNWIGNVGTFAGLIGLVFLRKAVPPQPVRTPEPTRALPDGSVLADDRDRGPDEAEPETEPVPDDEDERLPVGQLSESASAGAANAVSGLA
jgi:hypothetical protein